MVGILKKSAATILAGTLFAMWASNPAFAGKPDPNAMEVVNLLTSDRTVIGKRAISPAPTAIQTELLDTLFNQPNLDISSKIEAARFTGAPDIDLIAAFNTVKSEPFESVAKTASYDLIKSSAEVGSWQRRHIANLILSNLHLQRGLILSGLGYSKAAIDVIPNDIIDDETQLARYRALDVFHTALIMDRNVEQSLSVTKRLYELSQQVGKPPDTVTLMHNLGVLYAERGDYDTATAITGRMASQAANYTPYQNLIVNFGHGKNLTQSGQYSEAIPYLRSALTLSEGSPLDAAVKVELATAYAQTNKIANAERLAKDLQALIRNDHYNAKKIYPELKRIEYLIYDRKGETDKALEALSEWSVLETQNLKTALSSDRRKISQDIALTEIVSKQKLEALRKEQLLDAKVIVRERSLRIMTSIVALVLLLLLGLAVLSSRRLKTVNAELIESRDRALDGIRAKTDFLSVMSHEIRTPLNAILPVASLLKQQVENPEHRSLLSLITAGGTTLLNLVDNMLVIAKGPEAYKNEPIATDFSELIGTIIQSHAFEMQSNDVTLTVDRGNSIEGEIIVDAKKLGVLISNILSNAVKFNKNGHITLAYALTATAPERHLQISITDTGIGMDQSAINAYLEPFQQKDMSHTRSYEGLGIGLTVSNLYAKIIGAQLGIVSTVGHGTTVTVTLPVKYVSAQLAA